MTLVTRDCINVLKSMSSWSWDEYKAALTKKGYTIHERKDDDGILHGYAIMKGRTKYKASDLGIGRNLMVSKLPVTWEKLHYRSGIAANNKPKDTDSRQIQKPSASADYTKYKIYNPNTVPYTLSHEGQEHRFYIPEKVLNHFNDELLSFRFQFTGVNRYGSSNICRIAGSPQCTNRRWRWFTKRITMER